MHHPNTSFSMLIVLWAGQFLSKIGCGISGFALGLYLLGQTGSTSAYSFLLLAAFLPAVLLAPVGGVFADRVDRRLLMATGDCGSSLGIGFVIVMLCLYPHEDWPIYFGVVISSLFAALHSPALKASITDLVAEQSYGRASGLFQLTEASKYLLAPLLAAFLLERFSITVILVLDMATYWGAAATALLIGKALPQKKDTSSKSCFLKNLTDGFSYIRSNLKVQRLLYITILITFFTGILQSLLVPILVQMSDTITVGVVQSVAGSGMLLSSLLIGTAAMKYNHNRILFFALFTAGIFYILIGTGTTVISVACAAFCLFFTLPFIHSSLEVLFRQNIANQMQGRIWSIITFVSQTGMLLAFAIAGPLADHVFNPLMISTYIYADTFRSIFGTGVSRGSALMVAVCGTLFLLSSLYTTTEKKKHLRVFYTGLRNSMSSLL
ncbi:MAG: MFS transporter [Desulfopila sp.]|jgi:MFS family permease|nr:MFS transporter [Desulfopila sp.]